MSLLDAEKSHAPPAGTPRRVLRPLLRIATSLFLAAVAFLVWTWLAAWAKHGLDFSVYWYGGSILNEAGQPPSDLYEGNVDRAGGPSLPFTYPPFAALLFSLLARMPRLVALNLFNAAGVAVAIWVAIRCVRYWTAKADWRSIFRSTRNRCGAGVLLLAVLNLGPWRETLAFGQINILLMGLMMADLLARNPRWNRGLPGSGFLVGVAAGIKLTPLVFGLYFLVRKDWRGLLNMGAGFATTVLVGFLLRPAESLQFWLEVLPDTSRIGGAGYVDNLSIKGALLHFGVPGAAVTVPWLVLSLLVVALAAAVIKAASDHGAHHAADQPGFLVAPLGLGRGGPARVCLDPPRDSTPRPQPPVGHGRGAGCLRPGVPLFAEDHRNSPRGGGPQRPDPGSLDHGVQCRRVLRPRNSGVLVHCPPAGLPGSGLRRPPR
jgi:alpha-1,2-mannosyltransferase